MAATEQTLRSWHFDAPDLDLIRDPEHGEVIGYTPHAPDGPLPPAVVAEYNRVLSLDGFDCRSCAMGPDECATEGGAAIGMCLYGSEDTYGNETEWESFNEFVIIFLPLTSGFKAVSVCVDCDPVELYGARAHP